MWGGLEAKAVGGVSRLPADRSPFEPGVERQPDLSLLTLGRSAFSGALLPETLVWEGGSEKEHGRCLQSSS